MKILLITTLYPAYKNQSKIEQTYAVHYFAKEWTKNNDVSVMRLFPSYPMGLESFGKFKKNKLIKSYGDNYTIDGVDIKRVLIRKYPKITYRKTDIRNVAKNIIDYLAGYNIPDLIICDILNPSIYVGEIIARKFNRKLVASLHNSDIFYLKNNKNYKKYLKTEPTIDRIVFRSNNIERQFWEIYRGEKNKKCFSTILFGIESKDIINKEKIEDKLDNRIHEIMVACSLKKLKKIDILIKAFSKMHNRDNYILRIIGDGPERNNLIELSESLGCKSCIIFEGEKDREEVLNYMAKADIFAMVSTPETFGLVYIEAMAKGCITIGSKGEGIDGVIVDNVNGFLCTPNSVEELKVNLEKAVKLNEEDRVRIINNALNTVKELTYERLASKFLNEIVK